MSIEALKKTSNGKFFCQLSVVGDMTIYTASEDHKKLVEVTKDSDQFNVDLSKVEDIDTSGVQNLIALKNWADSNNKKLTFGKPSDSVVETLSLLNVMEKLDIPSANDSEAKS